MTDTMDRQQGVPSERERALVHLRLVNEEDGSAPDENGWSHGDETSDLTPVGKTLASVVNVLREHPEWAGVLRWDDFGKRVVFRVDPPAGVDAKKGDDLTDVLLSRIRLWFENDLGVIVSKDLLVEAVRLVARERAFHPVCEYLASLTWDETPRISTWLEDYCAVKPTSAEHATLIRAVATKWLVSCVARARLPGCKVDTMLILEGRQGIGKSTVLQALAGSEFFCDSLIDFGTKDACQLIQGVWIYELSELDALLRSESSRSKAFLSRAADRFRVPYGRVPELVSRSVVFCGTVNHGGYLKDRSGNRRFWIARCEDTIDVEGVRRVRDQLWAEATAHYDQGHEWHLTSAEEALMMREQEERIEDDPAEERIAEWLAKQGTIPVSMDSILEHALGVRGASQNSAITRRVAGVLEGMGYRRKRLSLNGRRCWRYVPASVLPSECPTDAE